MRRQKRKTSCLQRVWNRLSRIRIMITHQIKSNRYFLSASERHALTKEKNIRLRRVWVRLSRMRIKITKYQIKSSRYFLSACERHAQTKEKKYSSSRGI